jgi:hypothetical protein
MKHIKMRRSSMKNSKGRLKRLKSMPRYAKRLLKRYGGLRKRRRGQK